MPIHGEHITGMYTFFLLAIYLQSSEPVCFSFFDNYYMMLYYLSAALIISRALFTAITKAIVC